MHISGMLAGVSCYLVSLILKLSHLFLSNRRGSRHRNRSRWAKEVVQERGVQWGWGLRSGVQVTLVVGGRPTMEGADLLLARCLPWLATSPEPLSHTRAGGLFTGQDLGTAQRGLQWRRAGACSVNKELARSRLMTEQRGSGGVGRGRGDALPSPSPRG